MSDKAIAEKLLIKSNYTVLVVNEPAGYRSKMGELPSGVTIRTQPEGEADLVQVFVSSKKELEEQLTALKPHIKSRGLLWVTYPKGTSKIKVDINRDIIAGYARTIGLQGVAMISIDETWSALRLKVV
jgi:hypothetical protein